MAKGEFAVNKEKLEVITKCAFNAPCERVWEAYTSPTLIPQWWGPKFLTTTVDKMDVKTGGSWRFVQKEDDGHEFAFHGLYQEITEPQKLVYTFEFESMPGDILTETVVFEKQPDGTTNITAVTSYPTLEDLDVMVGSGMEAGAIESMERLAELVEKT